MQKKKRIDRSKTVRDKTEVVATRQYVYKIKHVMTLSKVVSFVVPVPETVFSCTS